MQHDLWDPRSLTRGQTQALAVKVHSPKHWAARESPRCVVSVRYITDFKDVTLKAQRLLKKKVKILI